MRAPRWHATVPASHSMSTSSFLVSVEASASTPYVDCGKLYGGVSLCGNFSAISPWCYLQLQNQSELRAPTAEKAAFFLDAAIASRRSSQRDCDEEDHRNSHMLFTLHIYQYRMEKSGKGGSKLSSCSSSPSPSSLPGNWACRQYSLVVEISRALHLRRSGAIHTSRLPVPGEVPPKGH